MTHEHVRRAVLTTHHLSSHWFETFPGVAKIVQSSQGRVAFDLDERLNSPDVPDGLQRKIHRLLHELSTTALPSEIPAEGIDAGSERSG